MNDLISRQAAIDLEPPERYERQYQTMNLDDAYESGWYDAQAGISQLPPADVRPVVRGQWKFATNPMLHDWRGPSCWCSECKKPPIDKKNVWYHLDGTFAREGEEFVLSDFCPHCGADMRGGDADGEEKD